SRGPTLIRCRGVAGGGTAGTRRAAGGRNGGSMSRVTTRGASADVSVFEARGAVTTGASRIRMAACTVRETSTAERCSRGRLLAVRTQVPDVPGRGGDLHLLGARRDGHGVGRLQELVHGLVHGLGVHPAGASAAHPATVHAAATAAATTTPAPSARAGVDPAS